RRRIFQGRFGGSEQDRREAPGLQDALDRLAHAGVILHDNNSRRFARHLNSPSGGSVRRLRPLPDRRMGDTIAPEQGPAVLSFRAIVLPFGAGGRASTERSRRIGKGGLHRVGAGAWSRSATRTSSASEVTCSFSITWARWAFTVRSEVPSSVAICL